MTKLDRYYWLTYLALAWWGYLIRPGDLAMTTNR